MNPSLDKNFTIQNVKFSKYSISAYIVEDEISFQYNFLVQNK